MSGYDQERFEVIRHHDAKGAWYRVIDKQSDNATIKTFRGRKAAHRYCAEANSGWRRVHAKGGKTHGRSLSGSQWFHEGMPS